MFDAIGVIIGVIVMGSIGLLLLIGGLGAGNGGVTFFGFAVLLATAVGAYRNWPRFPRAPPAQPAAPKQKPPNRQIAELD